MKSLNDPAEESLRKLMSQRFESYEKVPPAQLTLSVFDTLSRRRKHRSSQILLAGLLLICIAIVGGLLYLNKQKSVNERYAALSQIRSLKKQYPASSGNIRLLKLPESKVNKLNSVDNIQAIEPQSKASSGKSRSIPVLVSDLAATQAVRSHEGVERPILENSSEINEIVTQLSILNHKPVSLPECALKMREPSIGMEDISVTENSDAPHWKLIVGIVPTSSFQRLQVIPKDGLIYQNFRFAKPASIQSLGYKFQVGFERQGVQLLMNYSQFSHSVTYEVAGSEFILIPDARNDSKPVRKTKTIHDENSARHIAVGLKKHLLLRKGALRMHYLDLGAEFAKQLGGNNNALWLNASFGKEIQMQGRTSLTIGPYLEYSLQKFESASQVYISTPYQVGVSVGLNFGK